MQCGRAGCFPLHSLQCGPIPPSAVGTCTFVFLFSFYIFGNAWLSDIRSIRPLPELISADVGILIRIRLLSISGSNTGPGNHRKNTGIILNRRTTSTIFNQTLVSLLMLKLWSLANIFRSHSDTWICLQLRIHKRTWMQTRFQIRRGIDPKHCWTQEEKRENSYLFWLSWFWSRLYGSSSRLPFPVPARLIC